MKTPIRFTRTLILLLLTFLCGCSAKNDYTGTAQFSFASKEHQLTIRIFTPDDVLLFQLYSHGEDKKIELNMDQYRIYVESSDNSCSSPNLYIQVRPGKKVKVAFQENLDATVHY